MIFRFVQRNFINLIKLQNKVITNKSRRNTIFLSPQIAELKILKKEIRVYCIEMQQLIILKLHRKYLKFIKKIIKQQNFENKIETNQIDTISKIMIQKRATEIIEQALIVESKIPYYDSQVNINKTEKRLYFWYRLRYALTRYYLLFLARIFIKI